MQTLPARFLAALSRHFPDAWKWADMARAMRGDGLPDWPREVFLPYAGWYAIASKLYGVPRLDVGQVRLVEKLAAAGSWRPGQDIVRFEPALAESLMESELSGDIPADILWRLPAWCVYFDQKIDVAQVAFEGFFAHLEEDANDGRRELRLHFLREGDDIGFPVHIGPWSLDEGLRRMGEEAIRGAKMAGLTQMEAALLASKDVFLDAARKAINMILYVCVYGLDEGKPEPGAEKSYPTPIRTKKGWRLFPPDSPVIHRPGLALARALAEGLRTEKTGGHGSPRPHIRRGHWHGYWLGPRAERRLEARWLPPIPVAMREEDK